MILECCLVRDGIFFGVGVSGLMAAKSEERKLVTVIIYGDLLALPCLNQWGTSLEA